LVVELDAPVASAMRSLTNEMKSAMIAEESPAADAAGSEIIVTS